MEFRFNKEQEELRQEVHDFFVNELPEDYDPGARVTGDEEGTRFFMELQKKVVDRGWLTAGWPKKYGGLGFTSIEQGVISEEMGYWIRSLWPSQGGFWLAGPVILAVGTEEQKGKFVPPIARGDWIVLEAFTEPNAGSDEANCQLRAIPDGDDYILNGQKTFITGWVKPDWLYTLARTAETTPKHRGLSIFMVPGDAPGISYRPLPTMGGSMQNEIFYDNVRVPKENLIGEINRGFYAAMATFEFERASISQEARRGMVELVDFYRKEKRNGKPLIKDPEVRKMLARRAMQQQVMWLSGWHASWRRTRWEKLGPQTYDLTMFLRKDSAPDEAEAIMDTLGLYSQLKPGSKYSKYNGVVQRLWEASRVIHPAGSPEILKVVIANRGLGLPRIPRKFNTVINEALSEGDN